MQHRRERPTPRRQTHPPETPQTHLHPPSRPALASPSFKPFPRSRADGGIPIAAPVSQTHTTLHTTPRYPPTSRPLSPSAFSLSSLTVAALSYTTRLDPTVPIPARHPVRQPTTPTYRSDPRAISKIIPYILELGALSSSSSSSSSVEDRTARVGRRENMERTAIAAAAVARGTRG